MTYYFGVSVCVFDLFCILVGKGINHEVNTDANQDKLCGQCAKGCHIEIEARKPSVGNSEQVFKFYSYGGGGGWSGCGRGRVCNERRSRGFSITGHLNHGGAL